MRNWKSGDSSVSRRATEPPTSPKPWMRTRIGDAGLILNHMRGTPETWAKLPPLKNALATIAAELDASVHRAVGAGVHRTLQAAPLV